MFGRDVAESYDERSDENEKMYASEDRARITGRSNLCETVHITLVVLLGCFLKMTYIPTVDLTSLKLSCILAEKLTTCCPWTRENDTHDFYITPHYLDIQRNEPAMLQMAA